VQLPLPSIHSVLWEEFKVKRDKCSQEERTLAEVAKHTREVKEAWDQTTQAADFDQELLRKDPQVQTLKAC
jgi:hypothetical protein